MDIKLPPPVSAQTQKALQQLDKDGVKGVSRQEILKTLDSDGDGQISGASELAAAKILGVTATDLPEINKLLKARSDPSEILFPEQAAPGAAGKPPDAEGKKNIDSMLDKMKGEVKPGSGDPFAPADEGGMVQFPDSEATKLQKSLEASRGLPLPSPWMDAADHRALSTGAEVLKSLDLKLADGDLKDPVQKRRFLDALMKKTGGEAYERLPAAQKDKLLELMQGRKLSELMSPQVQGMQQVNSSFSSLNRLLADGRLSAGVLGKLQALQSAPLVKDLEDQREALFRSALQDIAYPARIDQHNRETCAATTVQTMLAIKHPERYLEVLTHLASPAGVVPNQALGGTASPPITREQGTEHNDDSERSLSCRLIQPAFMEYANGQELSYDNAKDVHSDTDDGKARTGLYQREVTHLTDAVLGKGHYRTVLSSELSGEGVVAEMEKALPNNSPIPAGMMWKTSGHEIMVTKIDRARQLVYFKNPHDQLQTMSLADFTRQVNSASIPTAAAGSSPFASLPGEMARPEAYKPIDRDKYLSYISLAPEDPAIKRSFTDEQLNTLFEVLRKHGLSEDVMKPAEDWLKQLSKHSPDGLDHAGALIDRLKEARSLDETRALLGLYHSLARSGADEAGIQNVLAAYPERHLSADELKDLDKQITRGTPGQDKVKALLERSRTRMLAGTMGPDAAKQPPTQAAILDRFNTLAKGGFLSGPDYKQLEELAAAADAGTKAKMIERLMMGHTSDRAEQAIATIIGGSSYAQQKEILAKLDLRRLGNETESPDRAAEMLNEMVRAGFDPKALSEHMSAFFDGVASQTHFSFWNETDDDTAMIFLKRLDDKALAGVPDSVKLKFFKALDAGNTPADEFAMMRRLASQSSPASKAEMIRHLMDQSTDADQEKLISQILLDTPAQGKDGARPLLDLVSRLDMSRLADELENDSEAAAVGAHLAKAYQAAGQTPIKGKLGDYLVRLAQNHRDKAITAFVSHPDMRAKDRALFKALDAQVLKQMMQGLMKGDTNEAEEDCIMTLFRATSWQQYDQILRGDQAFLARLGDELDSEDIEQLDQWTAELPKHT